MSDLIVISEAERDIRKWEIRMSADEMEELLTYKDVFKKYLQKKVNEYQAMLGSGLMKWTEVKDYLAFEIIQWLIDWLEKTEKNYQKFMEENSK